MKGIIMKNTMRILTYKPTNTYTYHHIRRNQETIGAIGKEVNTCNKGKWTFTARSSNPSFNSQELKQLYLFIKKLEKPIKITKKTTI